MSDQNDTLETIVTLADAMAETQAFDEKGLRTISRLAQSLMSDASASASASLSPASIAAAFAAAAAALPGAQARAEQQLKLDVQAGIAPMGVVESHGGVVQSFGAPIREQHSSGSSPAAVASVPALASVRPAHAKAMDRAFGLPEGEYAAEAASKKELDMVFGLSSGEAQASYDATTNVQTFGAPAAPVAQHAHGGSAASDDARSKLAALKAREAEIASELDRVRSDPRRGR